MTLVKSVAVAAGCLALAAFYVLAANEHAERINLSKARGDQSGYLWDAQNVYKNWHGEQPPIVIGERNRMPVYAGVLALVWDPNQTNDEFFEVGRRANIYLSLGLIALLGGTLLVLLPLHAAVNLTGVVAFGYFIFKAGYTQSELLFYFLFFLTFLGCWRLLSSDPGRRLFGTALVTGVLAAVSHLTKAAMAPFVAIFLGVHAGRSVWAFATARGSASPGATAALLRQTLTAVVVSAAFVGVLWPYLSTSKRVFGHYFYNVNSTFYVWYDNWPQASVGTRLHGDGVGWPTMPAADLPSASRYWREHSLGQITARIGRGLEDIALRSYTTYGYFKYLALYVAMLVALVVTRRQILIAMAKERAWLALFLATYGVVYILATAFYEPTSGTGTARFFLAHVLPFLYAATRIACAPALSTTGWTVGTTAVTLAHFQWLVTATIVLDVLFGVWPRLMTTYGGF